MIKVRDEFFDVLKFTAILLVIFGHIQAKGVTCDSFLTRNLIVGFNMPIFFAISGYFSYKTIVSSDTRRLIRHLRSYFWPLCVFSLIFAFMSMILGEIKCSAILEKWVRNFLFHGWYLWALAIMYCIAFCVFRIAKSMTKKSAPWVLLVLVYALLFFVVRVWHIANVRAMFPFFVLGFSFARYKIWQNDVCGFSCLFVYCAVLSLVGDIRQCGLYFYTMPTDIYSIASNPILMYLFLARVAIGVMGVIGFMWMVCRIMASKPMVGRCSVLGGETLGIYLMHQWFIDRLSDAGLFPCDMLLAIAYCMLIFALTHLISSMLKRNHMTKRVVWGLST